MKIGRPRERDRKELAKKLLEWCKLPDSINLNGYCISIDPQNKLMLFKSC